MTNTAAPKVIFLDIDGPMIPSSMMLIDRMASWKRIFPATTVAVMNRLCLNTGAKIVFNTTHNLRLEGVPDIEVALVDQGLLAEYLHPQDLKTDYPEIDRARAIDRWLARHPEVTHWVAIDDAHFTKKKNLVWVDPDSGVHVGHLNLAAKLLEGKPCLILM